MPEPVSKFRVSAICIHPVTKKLFLISANDHLLVIFNLTGKIEYIEKFDPKIFIQPEGLPFTEKGDMFISNEGKDKSPNYIAV